MTATTIGRLVAVEALHEGSDASSEAYAIDWSGEIAEVVQPTQGRATDGYRQWRGLRSVDIPLEFSDARLSGLLTISVSPTVLEPSTMTKGPTPG